MVRSSEQFTRKTRKARLICTNAACGHTFVVLAEAVKTLSPSAMPHPEVSLPMEHGSA